MPSIYLVLVFKGIECFDLKDLKSLTSILFTKKHSKTCEKEKKGHNIKKVKRKKTQQKLARLSEGKKNRMF